jgi:hypothetical protein
VGCGFAHGLAAVDGRFPGGVFLDFGSESCPGDDLLDGLRLGLFEDAFFPEEIFDAGTDIVLAHCAIISDYHLQRLRMTFGDWRW